MRDGQHFLPGCSAAPGTARRITAEALGEHPLLAETELVVSELVTNALRHTRSGQPGGMIGMTVERNGEAIRIEVVDNGPRADRPGSSPAVLPCDLSREHGRGLLLVDSLAHEWGVTDHPNGYRSVWVLLREDETNA